LSTSHVRTSFFEKKEAKKLLLDETTRVNAAWSQSQKFLDYFFSKKVTASSFEGSNK
jgi:hypothetical protein